MLLLASLMAPLAFGSDGIRAQVGTDKPDYKPGETVTISGDNSNFADGEGYQEGETVTVVVDHDANDWTATCEATAVADGSWSCQVTLASAGSTAWGSYTYTATGQTSGTTETGTFTDAPPATDLEQCRNGTADAPQDCVEAGGGTGWVTGNVGGSQAHLVEGYSIPYRAIMTDLPTDGTVITIVLEYDIKHSGRHAIDYITHYDRLEPHLATFGHTAENVDPTSGVTLDTATMTTWPIAAPSSGGSPVAGQPTTSFNALPANERLITLWGGTLSGFAYVSQGDLNAAQSSTSFSVSFQADSSTAVLAWGGHIASRLDWGFDDDGVARSAGGISGSPYHMRTISWNLNNLGNQDRSLAAQAVIAPGSLTISKVCLGTGSTTFNYSATGDGIPSPFTLDCGDSWTGSISAGTKTVTEAAPPTGWDFVSLVCNETNSPTSGNTPTTVAGTTATIGLDPGEAVQCTYTNAPFSVDIDKTGDTLSKVTDSVAYTITTTNTSPAGTDSLSCRITDPLLALDVTVTLAPGASDVRTPTYTVPSGAPDPLVNTASVSCTRVGDATVQASDTDGHSVNLFQPSVTIVKTGDAASKVGDTVNYTVTVSNTSSSDSPNLVCDVNDSLLGSLANDVSIAPGGTHVMNPTREVQSGDPDPLVNTATVTCSPVGFPNVLTASDSHSVNLFSPSVTIVKTGDALSKVGDGVDYTITVNNTSSSDTPDLVCTITDAMLNVNKQVTLASGGSDVTNVTYTVQPGDADPLLNTAGVSCNVTGFSNVVTASDGHSVNLFQPSVTIDKTGDALSKVGDSVAYTITVNNTSSSDTPDLVCNVTDSLLGSVATNVTLASGGSQTYNLSRTVASGDPDPLVNTASVSCSPTGFPNILTDSDDHTTQLFQPSITFSKTGDELSKVGDLVNYTIALNNTSSADSPDLVCTITDTMLGVNQQVTLASGGSTTLTPSRVVASGDPDPLVNTASVSCNVSGFSNVLTATDTHSVNLFQPSVTIDKTGDALSKVGDSVAYTITVNNTSSSDTPDMVCSITDSLLGSVASNVTFASGGSQTYNLSRTVASGDPDPLVNTATVNCSPTGFPNILTDADGHSTNLFQPSVTIDKTGDALSKVGDSVAYTITVNNTSSSDTPDMVCSVSDSLLGSLATDVTIASGGNYILTPSRTVVSTDPDPLENTATVTCSPTGFSNVLTASEGHSTNLFQPSITIDKTGDALSKVGDSVAYTITVNNTSSSDTPDMVCSVSDSLLGSLATNVTIASGGNNVINVSRMVLSGDPDPLVNTATVNCSPDGFPNVLTASDGHETNLFQPSIVIEKSGDALSKVGDEVAYVITLTNTSSADTPDMVCSITDSLLGVITSEITLIPAQSVNYYPTRVVVSGDPDPLVNTATANCSPTGFPNVLTDTDGHETNLFQPSVTIDKTGDALSKVGDSVAYTITVSNTSSSDSPNLVCTVTDSLLGTLATGVTIVPGANEYIFTNRTVLSTDPDPLVNNATVTCSPVGFPNILTASEGHSTNLFQPSITIDKTGDALSKVGDAVDYAITVNNTSSADTPELTCSVTDTLLGSPTVPFTVLPGNSHLISASRTVLSGDPDPLVNTATVNCSPAGFPNVLTASDGHSTNLFQPSVTIDKTGPAFTKAGDVSTYTITVNNTSSADTPAMTCTVTDSLLGSVFSGTLPSGETVLTVNRTTQSGDPNPLVNTATVNCSPAGFPNVLSSNESHSSVVLHPSFTVTKVCKAGTEPLAPEGPAVFTITFNNTGDADLDVVPSEGAPFSVVAGGSYSYEHTINGPFTGQSTVSNTVTGTVTLDARYNLANSYTFTASDDCEVGSRVNLVKTTIGGSEPVGGWTFKLYTGPDGFNAGSLLATDSTPPALLDFGNIVLSAGDTYTICEENVPAGWTSTWMVDTDADGVVDTAVTPYNPNATDTPPQDLGNRCVDFGAYTSISIPAGNTLVFSVDNSFPEGDQRTPGYWKNWSSCSGGNQYDKAMERGGGAEGFWTLDELLELNVFLVGDLELGEGDCEIAVEVLNKSNINNGKKMASDAAYNLATALFAAMLNDAAGAGTCPVIDQAILDAQAFLAGIDFDGTGSYLPPNSKGTKATQRAQALAYAELLDDYNNGLVCP